MWHSCLLCHRTAQGTQPVSEQPHWASYCRGNSLNERLYFELKSWHALFFGAESLPYKSLFGWLVLTEVRPVSLLPEGSRNDRTTIAGTGLLQTAHYEIQSPHRSFPLMSWIAAWARWVEILAGLLSVLHIRDADKSLARPTSRCILFDGENISFDDSLVICINNTNIPPIMIINRIYDIQNLLSL
jgi:hypothetical protein